MGQVTTLGHKKLASISFFQEYPSFQELLVKVVLHQFTKNFQQISQKFPIDFQQFYKHFFKCPTVNVKICKPSDFVHLSK